MRTQQNIRVDSLTSEQIDELDLKFKNAGWVICGNNDTVGSHSFRI